MTRTKERTIEDIRTELKGAEDALKRLADEETNATAELKRAADASRKDWQEAAISGEPLAASSEFAKITARIEELPGLLWAAKLRFLELRIEMREVSRAEELSAETEASAHAEKLRPRVEKLRNELQEVEADAGFHRMEAREINRELGELRRELAALAHRGPDAPKRGSTLLPRPNVFGEG